MFTPFFICFEDTALEDADGAREVLCAALTKVLLHDSVNNCSSAVDMRSYIVHSRAGVMNTVDTIELRSTLSQYTKELYTQETSDALNIHLRDGGFFKQSPHGRVIRTDWSRNVNPDLLANMFLLVALIGLLFAYMQRLRSTHRYVPITT